MTYKIVKQHRRGEEVVYTANSLDELAEYLNAKTGTAMGFGDDDIAIGGGDFEL